MSAANEVFGEVIHAYTRAQAIEDGVLIDVTENAREAGFKLPVALTAAVWSRFVIVPEGVIGQDLGGRLWDVLWMLSCAVRRSGGGSHLFYSLYVRNTNRRPKLVTLKAICGAGDDGEPVVTIMLPEED